MWHWRVRVDVIDDRSGRRRLTRRGRTRDEDQAAVLVGQRLDDRRKSEGLERRAPGKDAPTGDPDGPLLAEDVHAETAEAFDHVGEVDLAPLLERVRLLVVHEVHGGALAVGLGQRREFGFQEVAADTHVGRSPRLHMKVGALPLDEVAEVIPCFGHFA